MEEDKTTAKETEGQEDKPVEPEVEIFDTFERMGLEEWLLRGIYACGFDRPSAIQQRALVPLMRGSDVIVQSTTGTGKTATWAIGVLSHIDTSIDKAQALILCHTRELGIQSARLVTSLGSYKENLRCHSLVGGRGRTDEITAIRRGPQIITGTPGRVYDMINQGILDTASIKMIVFDEVDELFSRGFEDIMRDIFIMLVPDGLQVAFVSATLPPECLSMAQRMMINPIRIIERRTPEKTLSGLAQFYVNCEEERWKYDTLMDLVSDSNVTQMVIYCNTRRKAEWLTEKLTSDGFSVSIVTSGTDKEESEKNMNAFRTGSARFLILTDLARLSINSSVRSIGFYLNYDIPHTKENYIHRIGKSGFGSKGIALSFITKEQVRELQELESFYSTQIGELPGNFVEFL